MPEQVEMAAPLVQEQVALEEVTPEQAAPEEVEMAEEEVLREESAGKGDSLDDAQFIFGTSEKNLTEDQRAQLEERRKTWDVPHRVEQQVEQDDHLARQLQADKQRGVDRPIQVQPPKPPKQVAPPTDQQVAAPRQAFSLEIAAHSSDDEGEQWSLLLARKVSKQVAGEAEDDDE